MSELFNLVCAIGAAQFALSSYRHFTRPAQCGHTWGKAHETSHNRRGLRHQWRACKRCGAVGERYKLTRRGSWYLLPVKNRDNVLPRARTLT